ncbi:MAG: putative cytochrome c oxidase subunit [Acidimicrobiales bacterium]|nr:putative cytochrome c oxidase subunit [Acidimicrobiales bacterium]
MAVTETPPAAVDAVAEPAPREPHIEPRGLAAVLGSGDHKVIGRLYMGFAVAFGLGVAVIGVLTDLERLNTKTISILSVDTYAQVLSLHDVAFPYLVVAPLLLGLAFVIVPLQVGSAAIAFPRAAAASFWAWLMGSGLLITSYAMNGGPGGGRSSGVDLFAVSLGLVVASLMLAAVCLATTVLALRAPGLSLSRVPAFAWSSLVAASLWLVSLPVLLATLIFVYVDHTHASTSYGQNGAIASRIGWAISHPHVAILVVPVLGIVGEIMVVTARVRQAQRGVVLGAIAAYGIFSYGAFLQTDAAGITREPLFIGLSVLALLPLLVLLLLWADLFRRGTFRLTAPFVYAVSALLTLVVAVLAGAVNGAANLVHSAKFGPAVTVGITHMVLFAGLIGALGGLHWWATKVVGRPLANGPAMLAPVLMLVGAVVYGVPDVVSGMVGKGTEKALGIEGLNAVALVGIVIVLLGIGLAFASVLPALRRSADDVPTDPWEGHTLEWATASPPAPGNFDQVPEVTSAEPLLDQREEQS